MKYAALVLLLVGLVCALLITSARAGDEADWRGASLSRVAHRVRAYPAPAWASTGHWQGTSGVGESGRAMVPHPTTPELGNGTCTAAALGDLDGDGDLDAVVAGRTLEPSTVWLNDGSGAFAAHPVAPTLVISDTLDVALGDLDLDGDLDALLVNGHDEPETVWLNDGTGGLYRHDAFGGAGNTYAVALGDLDGDEDPDAVRVDFSEGTLSAWINDGAGHFTPHSTLPIFGYGSDPLDVELGDLDCDGDLDALVVNDIGNESVWLNDGTGALTEHGSIDTYDSFGGDLGDVDGDGDLDAVVLAMVIPRPPVWLNDGAANFGPHPVISTFGLGGNYELALGDMDGDGDVDAVAVGGWPNHVSLNDGTGHFVMHEMFGGGQGHDVELGDLDGDGDLDALVADLDGAQVWLNVPAWRMFLPVVGWGVR